MAQMEGMRERTVVINSMSKTYSVTGWRVGWAIAPPEITTAIRKVHDFLTVGAAAPLQAAGAFALQLPRGYYDDLQAAYRRRRDFMVGVLREAGFRFAEPDGAYYVMTDVSGFGATDDVAFVRELIARVGVAAVPGSSFYADPAGGRTQVRFAFPKRRETLEAAVQRLSALPAAPRTS